MKHIFLTGFMGSGKSTLGKRLATLLRLNFIDLDHYIEKKENAGIQLIFDELGEEAFRKMETDCLKDIFAMAEPLVIALGGGTVCFGDNLKLVKQHGLLVYLELPVNVLVERLATSKKKRPLLKDLPGDVLPGFISQKLEQRKLFYSQADLTISGVDLTAQLLQQAILEAKKDHTV